jgi:hypothetical protein
MIHQHLGQKGETCCHVEFLEDYLAIALGSFISLLGLTSVFVGEFLFFLVNQ